MVVGLGRFGSSLATTLMEIGHEVLAIDSDPSLVERYANSVTHAVEADTTEIEILRQLGVSDMTHAVVAIGNDIEASILTTAGLNDLGVEDIWAKAVTKPHASILRRVGADHVVFPEAEMGARVAHLVTGEAVDYVTLGPDFVMIETQSPSSVIGKTLANAHIREQFGVTVVVIKPENGEYTYATPETLINEGDLLLVAGSVHNAETFAALTKQY